jgi:hypothetical protein
MAYDEQAAQPATISTPSVSIHPLPEFNPDSEVGASLATRWMNWLDDFEMFILASGITDEKRKCALLLYQAGQHQLPNTGLEIHACNNPSLLFKRCTLSAVAWTLSVGGGGEVRLRGGGYENVSGYTIIFRDIV